jgi:hypothetical protein
MSDDQSPGGSEPGPKESAGAADAKSGQDQGGDSPRDKAADERAQEQAREEARFRNPNQSPFDDDEAPPGTAEGASRAYREARGSYTVHGTSQIFDGSTLTDVRFGDDYFLNLRAGAQLIAGPVPDEDLATMRNVYRRPQGYDAMREQLVSCRVLALCGEPGSGRSYTALALLDDLAAGQVSRLDPGTDLTDVPENAIEKKRGYVLELRPSGPDRLADMHLDRLRSLLVTCDSYCVLLVDNGVVADTLLRGRYGLPCVPPPAAEVLDSHLRWRLRDASPNAVPTATETASRADVKEALGLDEPRPQEAHRLAELLACHHAGELSDDDLLAECAEFAKRQVHNWFAAIDVSGELTEALPALRTAGFRIALAVFNDSSYSLVAEAGELLADELATTLDPEHKGGRQLFADDLEVRLVAGRAELDFTLDDAGPAGTAQVPVRTVRFLGDRLSPAILQYIWSRHHNLRGPVIRWLHRLGDDPRPQVWVRAALASGVLCAQDYTHTFEALIRPMAMADRPQRRVFAATAMDQANEFEPVRAAVRAQVRDWARKGSAQLRWTAAMVHGYGRVSGSVAASLDELGRIGIWDDGKLLHYASYNVVQLMGGRDAEVVLDRIADWLVDDRTDRIDLGLASTARLAATRTQDVWDPAEVSDLAPYTSWPLALALAAARPKVAEPLADNLWKTLNTARSHEAAIEAVKDWMRRCADDGYLDALEEFLPRLVAHQDDIGRLRWTVRALAEDPDDPLDADVATRLWHSIEMETD